MDVRNCIKCNKLFNYIAGQPLCANCKKDLEERFKDVKMYIRKNPNATVVQVAEATETDVKQIRQWVREERLSFTSDSAIGIECEMCGKTIKTGRFCDECKKDVVNNLSTAYHREESKPESENEKQRIENKMRFLNKDKI